MLTVLGNLSLILSVVVIILVSGTLLKKNQTEDITINRYVIVLGTSIYVLCILIASVSLVYSHLMSDFGIQNVYTNSHSAQPLLFKLCGLWGNHEGSMLLWVLILSLYTYSIIFIRVIPYHYLKWTILNQFFFNIFFILYTLLTSNPFLINLSPVLEGKELNPILQDVVLSIHPPLIYMGYIGLSVPFSMTVAYLILKGKYFNIWSHYVRLYNLIAWLFLTTGILLGSWWAYYELGWGGWWFWDPVENASLLPWILSTSLTHTIIATQKSRNLTHWSIILSLFSFFSSILGTFFVRSGFLDSVHSFAADSNRGLFILFFLLFLFLIILYLFIQHTRKLHTQNIKTLISREGVILINQLFFIYFYIIVAIGTFYPTIYEYIFNKSITIGPSFYNQAIIPILIPFLVLMLFSLETLWSTSPKLMKKFKEQKIIWVCVLFFNLAWIYYLYSHSYKGPYILYIIVVILMTLFIMNIYKIKIEDIYKTIQMRISHIAFTIFSLAITLWYCLHKEAHQIMYPGDRYIIDNYEYIFRGINLLKGPNYDSFYGSYLVLKDGVLVSVLFPEKRHYFVQDFYTSKVDIHSNMLNDVHVIIGDGNIYTGWATSMYIYPFMSWIWLGGIILIAGTIISIYKLKKEVS